MEAVNLQGIKEYFELARKPTWEDDVFPFWKWELRVEWRKRNLGTEVFYIAFNAPMTVYYISTFAKIKKCPVEIRDNKDVRVKNGKGEKFFITTENIWEKKFTFLYKKQEEKKIDLEQFKKPAEPLPNQPKLFDAD